MKTYRLAQVLSVVTCRLFCRITEMKDFMADFSGHEVWSHDIVRIADGIRPWILQQHPFLGEINVEHVDSENVWDELAKIEAEHGSEIQLEPMPSSAIAQLSLEESIRFAGFQGEIIATSSNTPF